MKYYIIAGEASGDLHGSNLVASLRAHDPDATIRAWGGEKMRQNGANVVKNYHDLAFMGFVEVLINLNTILKNIKFCKKYITEFAPDALILIDYPGFNLKIAKWAKKQGYKVFYYISPQVWAWKRRRVYKIKRVVDKMLCILPFEKKFYDNYGVDCQFVGHPLLDEIAKVEPADRSKFYKANRLNPRKEIIAMLPGSRKQEVSRMLTVMLQVVKRFPDYQFVIACAPSLPMSYYKQFVNDKSNVKLVRNRTYQLLQLSSAAMVTSGTATLETALLDVPEVVCYKANKISYLIARLLAKVKYICLVNLIMDRVVVKELIQGDMTAKNITDELRSLLNNQKRQRKLLEDYDELKYVLGNAGASDRTAETIIANINLN